MNIKEEKNWHGKKSTDWPGHSNQPLGTLPFKQTITINKELKEGITASVESHGVTDGVISVDAESYEDICWAVGNNQLTESEQKSKMWKEVPINAFYWYFMVLQAIRPASQLTE